MSINDEAKEKFKEALKNQDVAIAYLFGSYARGTAGPLSDIDIAVVFSQSVPREEYGTRELHVASCVGRLLNSDRVDVINLITATNPVLRYKAVFDGTLIFADDPKEKFYLERAILRTYEDTRSLRETAAAILRRQIASGEFGKTHVPR